MNRKKIVSIIIGTCLLLSMTILSFAATEYFTINDFVNFAGNQYVYKARNVIAEVGDTPSNYNWQEISVSDGFQYCAIPTVKTNENGETYGSASTAETIEAVPDLISAMATNGAEGYIKKSDVYQDRASTPEEAIALQNLKTNNPIRTISVYMADGTTVIGTFDMGQSAEAATTKPSYLSE